MHEDTLLPFQIFLGLEKCFLKNLLLRFSIYETPELLCHSSENVNLFFSIVMQKKELFFFKIFSKNRRTQEFSFYPCGMYSSIDFVLMLLTGSGQFFLDLFCRRYINLDPVLKKMRNLLKFTKRLLMYTGSNLNHIASFDQGYFVR